MNQKTLPDLPESTSTVDAEDAFAAAFAAFQAPSDSAPAPAPAPAPATDEDNAVSDSAADGDNGAPSPAPEPTPVNKGVAPPAAPPPEDNTPAPAPAPAVDAQIAALQAELAALKAAQATPSAPPAPVQDEAPLYSADEQAALEKYRSDWADVQAGEALIRRGEYRQLVGYIFNEVQKHLQPIAEFTQRQQGRTQYDDLVALVPDYDEVRDKTLAWVETQPEYLKAAYKQVAASGTPADVADLIARYKKESGYAASVPTPVPTPAPTPAPAVSTASLPPAAAVAAKGLRVVKSGRTEPAQGSDPNDFSSAFDAFAKSNSL
ncbi:MAG: hypothetical protein ACKO0Z_28695 [Betaproteobacteria bacterium]